LSAAGGFETALKFVRPAVAATVPLLPHVEEVKLCGRGERVKKVVQRLPRTQHRQPACTGGAYRAPDKSMIMARPAS